MAQSELDLFVQPNHFREQNFVKHHTFDKVFVGAQSLTSHNLNLPAFVLILQLCCQDEKTLIYNLKLHVHTMPYCLQEELEL